MHWNAYERIWFTLGLVIDTIELYILKLVFDFDLQSRLQVYEKAKTYGPIVLLSFKLMWMKFNALLRPISLMNLMLIKFLFRSISIQGSEPYLSNFFKKAKKQN